MMDWDPDFLERSPMFEPLRMCGARVSGAHWPSLDDMQRLIATREPPLTTRSGAPLKFVPQARKPRSLQDRYEARIFLKGEVQMRSHNWHDLLNALAWLTFPQAKAALNERHYRALLQQEAAGAPNRGPVQDAMTLFDEGGVIVAARDRELLRLIESFAWKDLFWHNRRRVMTDMRFFLFGHALYEKALAPFTGITARGILFAVEPAFIDEPLRVQISRLDTMLAARLLDPRELSSPRELAPVPILGVPGWCADNARESYYDNLEYFRAGRRDAYRARDSKKR